MPPDLSHVQTPTLVLYGEHEAPPVKRPPQRVPATVTGGAGQEIHIAGHMVNQDNPGAFDVACTAVLATLDSTDDQRTGS